VPIDALNQRSSRHEAFCTRPRRPGVACDVAGARRSLGALARGQIGKVEKDKWVPHTVRIYNRAPDIPCKPSPQDDWLRITPTHVFAFEDNCRIATIERWREHGRERFKVLSFCSFGDNEKAKWFATFELETNGPTKSVNHKWLSLNVEEDD
jgi:hypothetical protein